MKKIVCLLLCFVILAVPVMSMGKVAVEYNGTEIAFPDVQPVLKDGKPILPLRAVFETVGAGVFWEETERMVMSQRNISFVILQIGSPTMFVGNNAITIEETPYIHENRTMISLDVLEKGLNLKTEWDTDNSVVRITE